MENDNIFKLKAIKWLCVTAFTLTATIALAMILTACSVQQSTLVFRECQIVTEVVEIIVSGNQAKIVELDTGRTHIFKLTITPHRQGSAPPQVQRKRVETENIRIFSYRAVLVIHENSTNEVHIISI